MARTVKQKDGTTREAREVVRGPRSPGFVELVSSPSEARPSEAVCEIVLVSGRRLFVREEIEESRLRQLVRSLEQEC